MVMKQVGEMMGEAMNKRRDEDLEHFNHTMFCKICNDEWTARKQRGFFRRIWEAIRND